MLKPMLRLPIHGFAKRVEDTVARGMAALRARDELNAKRYQPVLRLKSKEQAGTAGRKSVSPRDVSLQGK
jgi:hypothetical protein